MKKNKIQDYLPDHTQETRLIQGQVPFHLLEDVKKQMDEDKVTWSELLTACLKFYVDQKK